MTLISKNNRALRASDLKDWQNIQYMTRLYHTVWYAMYSHATVIHTSAQCCTMPSMSFTNIIVHSLGTLVQESVFSDYTTVLEFLTSCSFIAELLRFRSIFHTCFNVYCKQDSTVRVQSTFYAQKKLFVFAGQT